MTGLLADRQIGLKDALDDPLELQGLEVTATGAAFELADPKERREGFEHLIEIADRGRYRGGRHPLLDRLRLGAIQALAQAVQGRPEIMRDIRRYMAQSVQTLLLPVEQGVEVAPDGFQLDAQTNRGHAFTALSFHDARRRCVDPIEP